MQWSEDVSFPQPQGPGDLTVLDLRDPACDAMASAGWGAAERHGRWSLGPAATLDPSAFPDDAALTVTITATPYLHPPELTRQRIQAELVCGDAAPLALGAWELAAYGSVTVPVPACRSAGDRAGRALRLALPDATAPASFPGTWDVRVLGIAATDVSVRLESRTALAIPEQLPKLAVVTMAYNERVSARLWYRHYSAQVGAGHCYMLDHGSDDGSMDGLAGANVIRIPRSPFDPAQQSRFISQFCASLLEWYDWVLYTDADELIVADPLHALSLRHYCALETHDVVTTVGLNLIHRRQREPAIDLDRPILPQRRYCFFSSSMCKPTLIRRPTEWTSGYHSAVDQPFHFGPLYRFHLRWFDLGCGLARMATTRAMPWVSDQMGLYQRFTDEKVVAQYDQQADLPSSWDVAFDLQRGPLRQYCEDMLNSGPDGPNMPYPMSLNIWGNRLFRIPDRFIGLA